MLLNVLVRLDAYTKIGLGHLVRCMTITESLPDGKYNIVYFISEKSSDSKKLLNPEKNTIIIMPNIKNQISDANWVLQYIKEVGLKIDFLVLDHYGLDKDWCDVLYEDSKKVVVIDDLANRYQNTDVLIDTGLNRQKSEYENLCNNDIQMLLGKNYCMLKPNFLNCINNAKSVRKNTSSINKILVSFGASDPRGFSIEVIDMLSRNFSGEIHVLTTSLNEMLEVIKNKEKHNNKIKLHLDIIDVVPILLEVDLCIGALGASSIERICLGLPSICVATEQNQQHNANNLASCNVITLSDINSIEEKLIDQLKEGSMKGWHLMSESCFEMYDGLGVYRVISQVFKETLSVQLVEMTESDVALLYAWQTENNNRKYSRNDHIPTWQEHQNWFEESLRLPSRRMWKIVFKNSPCGYVRLDEVEETESPRTEEVSILISTSFRQLGVAFSALSLVKSMSLYNNILAEVNPLNEYSALLFKRAGFCKTSPDTYHWNSK